MNILRQVSASLLSSSHAIFWWQTDSLETSSHGLNVQIFGSPTTTFYPAVTTRVVGSNGLRTSYHRVEVKDLTPGASVNVKVVGPSFLQTVGSSFYPRHQSDNLNIAVIGSSEGNVSGLSDAISYDESVNSIISFGGFMPTHIVSIEDVENFLDTVEDPLRDRSFVCATSTDATKTDMSVFKTFPASRRYFTTTLGPVAIMCLDTSRSGRRSLSADQEAWASDVFSSTWWKSSSYRIVVSSAVFRTSIWDNSASFGNGTGVDSYLERKLLPLFKQSGASLIICGEAKSYQRGSVESTYPSVKGSTSNYITCGGIPPSHTNTAWDSQPEDEPSIFVEAARPHLVRLHVTTSTMTMSCVDVSNDTLIDSIVIPSSSL